MGCKEDKFWPISDNSQYNFPFPVFFFHVGKKGGRTKKRKQG
jgi:hypothetical protein